MVIIDLNVVDKLSLNLVIVLNSNFLSCSVLLMIGHPFLSIPFFPALTKYLRIYDTFKFVNCLNYFYENF